MFYLHMKDKLLLLSLLFLLCSCDPKHVFEENRHLEGGIWNTNQKMTFEVSITDTSTLYKIYINLRNGTDYPFSNLYLFLKTTFPDGNSSKDTIECILADYDGHWRGSGMGSVKFNRFVFQKRLHFPQKGTYHFEFEQAMRVNKLKGIQDIGLRIER